MFTCLSFISVVQKQHADDDDDEDEEEEGIKKRKG